MRVGLVGGRGSPDLACLKREIEDRGHKTAVVSPRKFPQYAFAAATWGSEPAGTAQGPRRGLRCDHVDLLDCRCFYLHEFDLRDRFFRGEFGKDVWIALRDRYLEFTESEVENVAFQMSLSLSLGEVKPTVNSPRALLGSRLRPWIYFRLARMGLPVVPYQLGPTADAAALSKRLRIGEDFSYDVPCFPRDLANVISLNIEKPGETWRVLAVSRAEPSSLMIAENGAPRSLEQPGEAGELAEKALAALGLDVAEVHLARYRDGLRLLDVLPSPGISEFEEVTGERGSGKIAERVLQMGGSN